MPSLRYSVSGSAPALVNGSTASESIAGLLSSTRPRRARWHRPRRPALRTGATARARRDPGADRRRLDSVDDDPSPGNGSRCARDPVAAPGSSRSADRGVSLRIDESTERFVSPVNGRVPVVSSYRITPREKTSDRSSTVFAFRLFRRHVVRRADDEPRLRAERRAVSSGRPVEELGQAEVEHLHVAIRPHHDVFRLDVTVGDPARVRGGQCARDLNRDARRPRGPVGRRGRAVAAASRPRRAR